MSEQPNDDKMPVLITSGQEFEQFLCDRINAMDGMKCIKTKASGDQGVDLIACVANKKIAIQCKLYSESVGNSAVQEVVAGRIMYKCDIGCVVTNSTYTKSAKELATATGIILLNYKDILRYLTSLIEDEEDRRRNEEDRRRKEELAAVEKEKEQILAYQKLYDSIKDRCALCGGHPDVDSSQLTHMTGHERDHGEYRTLEFVIPVCNKCYQEWRHKCIIADDEIKILKHEIEAAQKVFAKKEKLWRFLEFGYDKAMQKAREPLSILTNKLAMLQREYPELGCRDKFILTEVLRNRGYVYGCEYNIDAERLAALPPTYRGKGGWYRFEKAKTVVRLR